jgi:hypothetical protein
MGQNITIPADVSALAGQLLGSLPTVFRPSLVGEILGTAWGAGNFTGGTRFQTHRALSIVGVRFWARWTGSKTITARIYRSDTVGHLATVNLTLDATVGQIATATFAAPLALPVSPVGTTYSATVYESAGGFYPVQAAASAAPYFCNSSLAAFFLASGVIYHGNTWVAGNARPTNNYNVGSTEFFAVEPVFG